MPDGGLADSTVRKLSAFSLRPGEDACAEKDRWRTRGLTRLRPRLENLRIDVGLVMSDSTAARPQNGNFYIFERLVVFTSCLVLSGHSLNLVRFLTNARFLSSKRFNFYCFIKLLCLNSVIVGRFRTTKSN